MTKYHRWAENRRGQPVFEFLLEHRTIHFNFLSQNLGINVLGNVHASRPKGLLERSVTKYAHFDFGNSKQYPQDLSIDQITDTRFFGFDLRGYPDPEGPYNLFQVEMLSVGDVLQRHVRLQASIALNKQRIEDIVPPLGPFFDAMMNEDASKRLTAHEALTRFQEIYSDLSDTQMNHEVVNLWWEKVSQTSSHSDRTAFEVFQSRKRSPKSRPYLELEIIAHRRPSGKSSFAN
ncbi:hypothetical protein BDN70DRAFT_922162 [Pholiota conissans]|uniref:Uncharacterized protein n=1 Tax=Pholiota conissans TaxID=109636 RepID=A0A9P6CSD2_9AGAR|nr:hypothetical protein BDN70DRAFT_922162 [Pholiota conissans]